MNLDYSATKWPTAPEILSSCVRVSYATSFRGSIVQGCCLERAGKGFLSSSSQGARGMPATHPPESCPRIPRSRRAARIGVGAPQDFRLRLRSRGGRSLYPSRSPTLGPSGKQSSRNVRSSGMPYSGPVRVRPVCWGSGPGFCALVQLSSGVLVRPCRGLFSGQPAMASAVAEVDHEPYRHPHEEPKPGAGGQKTHEEEA